MEEQAEYWTDILGRRHFISDVEAALVRVSELLHGQGTRLYNYQRTAILHAFEGIDTIISVRTNGGKTAMFEGALVLYELLYNGDCDSVDRRLVGSPDYHQVLVLVACPLVALMGDMVAKFMQSDAAKRLGLVAAHTAGQLHCARSVICH